MGFFLQQQRKRTYENESIAEDFTIEILEEESVVSSRNIDGFKSCVKTIKKGIVHKGQEYLKSRRAKLKEEISELKGDCYSTSELLNQSIHDSVNEQWSDSSCNVSNISSGEIKSDKTEVEPYNSKSRQEKLEKEILQLTDECQMTSELINEFPHTIDEEESNDLLCYSVSSIDKSYSNNTETQIQCYKKHLEPRNHHYPQRYLSEKSKFESIKNQKQYNAKDLLFETHEYYDHGGVIPPDHGDRVPPYVSNFYDDNSTITCSVMSSIHLKNQRKNQTFFGEEKVLSETRDECYSSSVVSSNNYDFRDKFSEVDIDKLLRETKKL